MGLRKAGGNWVEGDRFFVDLEDAPTAADAVVEIAAASTEVRGSWNRVKDWIAKSSTTAIDRVDELGVSELRVKLRFGIDAGSWRAKGDALFASLAASEKPVVLAIDELPILVNRLLKGHDYKITPERRRDADGFLIARRCFGACVVVFRIMSSSSSRRLVDGDRNKELQPRIPDRRRARGSVLRQDGRVRFAHRDPSREHRQLEPARHRDRSTGQWKDDPASASRFGGPIESGAFIPPVSDRLGGRELWRQHLRRVLAGVSVPPVRAGASTRR